MDKKHNCVLTTNLNISMEIVNSLLIFFYLSFIFIRFLGGRGGGTKTSYMDKRGVFVLHEMITKSICNYVGKFQKFK